MPIGLKDNYTMKMLFPDASLRSPTAVAGKSDLRDENVVSSGVVQHGGAGTIQLYTVPRGQQIPALAGAGITAPTSAHQMKYSELTTSITQAGQFGSALGEGSIRGIGIDIETGYYTFTTATSTLNAYGAGQQEIQEITNKMWFRLSIGGKKQIESGVRHLPASGGVIGSVAANGLATAAGVSALANGWTGALRRLKVPILVARTDTVVGDLGVAGGDALVFSVTSGVGQPCLIFCNTWTALKGDAR